MGDSSFGTEPTSRGREPRIRPSGRAGRSAIARLERLVACNNPEVEYAFEDWVLSVATRVLRRNGVEVAVQPKVFDLLLYLAAHPGRLVSHSVLDRELWPDSSVTSASLPRLVKEARRALSDDGRRQAIIKTVHGRGYRFVAEVRELGGGQRLYFGRHRLLDTIESNLSEACAGTGRLVLIEGAPGIGKSSTLLEVGERARLLGMNVVDAWGQGGAVPPSFWLWVQAIRTLVDEGRAPALPRELSSFMDGGDTRDPNGPSLDPAGEQFRLFDAVRRFLREAARRCPLAILADDLHASDTGSLALLEFLEPALAGSGIFIVGSYRPEEVELHPRRTRSLLSLASRGSVSHWPIGGLGEREVESLVEHRTGLIDRPRFVSVLTARTDGNPFFIEEILRYLISGANLDGDALESQIDSLLPKGVEAMIERRLNGISDRSESLLRLAAAIGQEFEVEILERTTEWVGDEVAASLREASEARLIVRRSRSPLRYGFSHALIREQLAIPLAGQAEYEALHLRIARALENVSEGRGGRTESIAYHLSEALPLAPLDDAVSAHVAAARVAGQRWAFDQSAEHYERALELLERREIPNEELRCDLLLEIGELRLGSEGRDSARKSFARACKIARRLQLHDRLARATLGFAYRRIVAAGPDEEVVALLGEALEAIPQSYVSQRSQIRARLGVELLFRSPPVHGRTMIEAAVEEARCLGDPKTLASALECQTYSIWSPGDPKGFIALNQEIEALAEQAKEPDLWFRGIKSQAAGHLEQGDRTSAQEIVDACDDFVNRLPLAYARWITSGLHAMLALLDGRLADAHEHVAASREAGRQDEACAMAVLAQSFWLGLFEGGIRRLEAPLAHISRAAPDRALTRAGLARVFVETERAVDARGELETVVLRDLDTMPYDRDRLITLAICAEVSEALGAAPLASKLLSHLQPHAHVHVVVGSAALYYGSVAHHIGLLHLACGEWEESERALEQAARVHAEIGSPPWVAETRHALARLYLRRGETGDAARARRRAKDAQETAERYGLVGLGRRIRSTVEDLSVNG